MPCNAIAVVRATLSAGVFEAISQDARAAEALRVWLQEQTGTVVTCRRTVPDFLAFDFGGRYPFVVLTLSQTSGLQLNGGTFPLTVDAIADFCEQLRVAVQQQQLVAAIQQSAFVQSDSYDSAGNRVLLVSA